MHKKEVQNDRRENNRMFEFLRNAVKRLQGDNESFEKGLGQVKEDLVIKADKMECENLRQSILLLPTTDDLRKVQHHTFSNIK